MSLRTELDGQCLGSEPSMQVTDLLEWTPKVRHGDFGQFSGGELMTRKYRVFSQEVKLAMVRRMLAGENVIALARELKVKAKDLYRWRSKFRAGGAAALRGPGRGGGKPVPDDPPDAKLAKA